MPKIRVEIEVPSSKYCDVDESVCPMFQEGNFGEYYCSAFGCDLEFDINRYSFKRCDECKQAEVEGESIQD